MRGSPGKEPIEILSLKTNSTTTPKAGNRGESVNNEVSVSRKCKTEKKR